MKKLIKKIIRPFFCFISLCSIFFLFSGQKQNDPAITPFIGLMAEPFRFEGVHIYAKAYSPYESQIYLNRNLLGEGIQPIQVSIQNNTQKTYILTNRGVDLPTKTMDQVTSRVNRSAIPRFIFFKVAGFLFWPFLIPGTLDTIYTLHSHFTMKRDYLAKTIKDRGELLTPYSCVHRVIFVSREKTTDAFDLYLQEQKSGSFYPFQVKINS